MDKAAGPGKGQVAEGQFSNTALRKTAHRAMGQPHPTHSLEGGRQAPDRSSPKALLHRKFQKQPGLRWETWRGTGLSSELPTSFPSRHPDQLPQRQCCGQAAPSFLLWLTKIMPITPPTSPCAPGGGRGASSRILVRPLLARSPAPSPLSCPVGASHHCPLPLATAPPSLSQ